MRHRKLHKFIPIHIENPRGSTSVTLQAVLTMCIQGTMWYKHVSRSYARPPVQPSICPSFPPPVRMSIREPVRLFVPLTVRPSVRLPIRPSVRPSYRLCIFASVPTSIRPTVHPSVQSVLPSVFRSDDLSPALPSVCLTDSRSDRQSV